MAIKVIFILLYSILILGTIRGESSLSDYYELSDSLQIMEDTVAKIDDENRQIKNEIEKIKQSPSYARRVLRDKYHITDENEEIVFFAD